LVKIIIFAFSQNHHFRLITKSPTNSWLSRLDFEAKWSSLARYIDVVDFLLAWQLSFENGYIFAIQIINWSRGSKNHHHFAHKSMKIGKKNFCRFALVLPCSEFIQVKNAFAWEYFLRTDFILHDTYESVRALHGSVAQGFSFM
jgi:hypothetical protein